MFMIRYGSFTFLVSCINGWNIITQEGEAELLIAKTVIAELSAHGIQVQCSFHHLNNKIHNSLGSPFPNKATLKFES